MSCYITNSYFKVHLCNGTVYTHRLENAHIEVFVINSLVKYSKGLSIKSFLVFAALVCAMSTSTLTYAAKTAARGINPVCDVRSPLRHMITREFKRQGYDRYEINYYFNQVCTAN